jgi:opacity protein-like surface antigen
MKFQKIFLQALLALGLGAPALADLQLGFGPSLYSGTKFEEENGTGLNAEIGLLFDNAPIDLFLGTKLTYVDGLSEGASEMDVFEGSLAARILVPVSSNWLKLYAEGSIGTANLSVSGQSKYKALIKGKDFSFNTNFDDNDWVFSVGLGVGIQFDFNDWIGLRVGYELHNFGDVQVFGLKSDPGSLNGFVSSLVLKF